MALNTEKLIQESIDLLKNLISTPSFSREENESATLIENFFKQYHFSPLREKNNVWLTLTNHIPNAPVILLNSHHDTVKPGDGWNTNPTIAVEKAEMIFGLGSNDAGASVVSLIAVFRYFSQKKNLPFKLIIALSAEEEVSGENGIRLILPKLGNIDLGIVGEPTQMHAAIAEKGLIVLDCIAHGKTGHAAREEGENALYKALSDIHFFRNHPFQKDSELLGKTKMTVTQIAAGSQHNVVPDKCHFVVDIRTNEHYDNQRLIENIKQHIQSEITPRSYHLNSSQIDMQHPIVQQLIKMGRKTYGSPTLSDQSVMPFTTIKLGPGESARSHTPNEYIKIAEIKEAVLVYINCLEGLNLDSNYTLEAP